MSLEDLSKNCFYPAYHRLFSVLSFLLVLENMQYTLHCKEKREEKKVCWARNTELHILQCTYFIQDP